MIYYRSAQGARDLSVGLIRTLSLASLLAYPAGALLLALGPDTPATSVSGYGLILLALVAYAPLIGSSIQRIVAEEVKTLDEYQLRLRSRALSISYMWFSALALLAIIYAAIASDKGGWVPSSYEEYNGVFWGIFLLSNVLPTAVLSWIVEPSFADA